MAAILKYAIILIIFITLVFVYFFFTPLGNQRIYGSVSTLLSEETGLDVKVKSVDILEYPYLEADMLVEEKYNLNVKGYLQDDQLDMEYRLTSNCLQSDICTIDDNVDVVGPVSYTHLRAHETS